MNSVRGVVEDSSRMGFGPRSVRIRQPERTPHPSGDQKSMMEEGPLRFVTVDPERAP